MDIERKILFVDDEVYVLESFKRELGFKYTLDTAQSGVEGLAKIDQNGPFAVVVADYRMPKMDGVQFLQEVMRLSPDTVRIMLTGNADLQTAIQSVNEGQIFRFLTKPCPADLLTKSLQAALEQYRLIQAEKELLEKTLLESVKMMGEVLSLVKPQAYGKALRVRNIISVLCKKLNLNNAWQYEIAASLSQLGWITFPPELVEKVAAHKSLNAAESLLFSRHPFSSRKLLENIPRLELVARIIEGQERSIEDLCLDEEGGDQYFVDLGSHLLRICLDYDSYLESGRDHAGAVAEMFVNKRKYKSEILEAMATMQIAQPFSTSGKLEEVKLDDLETGMLVAESIRDKTGNILVDKGVKITRSVLIQLLCTADRPGFVVEPIKVIRHS